jgi:CRP-like cAMP-binding protein
MTVPVDEPLRATVAELRGLSLFSRLSEADLGWLCDRLGVHRPAVGETFLREGDSGRDLFVILEGELEVTKSGRDRGATRVALLGPGDWFGEMGLLEGQPRSASARVLSATRLLRVDASDLDALRRWDLGSYSVVLMNLARELSRRLRVADGLLADFVGRVVSRRSGDA